MIMYSTFACLLVLGRVAVESRWIETLTAWGPAATATIFVASVFAPLALFGPGVLTVLLVWRSWPGQGPKKFWLSVIPAAITSLVVTLMYWMFLNDGGFAWSNLVTSSGWFWWVFWWIAATIGIIWFDTWLQRPKQLTKSDKSIR